MSNRELDTDKFIVVTGGAGFIGSGVIAHLNSKNISSIIVVDELDSTTKWKNLVGKDFYDFIPKNELFTWLKDREHDISSFIHLGACTSTTETDGQYLLENNYHYTLKLAEYALDHNHRFIYASSAATYGDGQFGFVDDENELLKLKPLNMYGFSKQLFDQWAKKIGAFKEIVGLKYFNVYGPNEQHKGPMASAITKMVPDILTGRGVKLFKSLDPNLYKDGEQKRDFIYVKDTVRMTCAFLENDASGLFNIGTGIATSWNRLAAAVFHALDLPIQIEYIETPDNLKAIYQNFSQADMTKTRSTLGSIADCPSLEQTVKEYVCEYIMKDRRW